MVLAEVSVLSTVVYVEGSKGVVGLEINANHRLARQREGWVRRGAVLPVRHSLADLKSSIERALDDPTPECTHIAFVNIRTSKRRHTVQVLSKAEGC